MVLAALVVGGAPGLAQPPSNDAGLPFARHFSPKDIRGGPQFVASAMAPDGVLYFAANRSISSYDGIRWRNLSLGPPRRLAIGPEGRVWVGCDGDLGYLETHGELRFVSLRPELPPDDRPTARIMGLERVGDDLYFIYTDRVIRWSAGQLQARTLSRDEDGRAEGGGDLEASTVYQGRLWVHRKGHGPAAWPSETEAPMATRPRPTVGYRNVHALLDLGDGSLLIGTADGRLHRWHPSFGDSAGASGPANHGAPPSTAPTSFSPEAEERLGGSPVWSLSRLRDGTIAVGSRGRGMLLLGLDGELRAHYSPATGLPGKDVYTVLEDLHGSLWLGISPGIVRLSRQAPITVYDALDGPESMLGLVRHRGELYIGSVLGGYRLRPGRGPEPARFEPVEGLEGHTSTWASTPHGLLAAGNHGVRLLEGRTARTLLPQGQSVAWHGATGAAIVTHDDRLRVLIPDAAEGFDDGAWRDVDHPGLLPERVYEVLPEDTSSGGSHPGAAGHGEERPAFWLVTLGTRTLYRLDFPDGIEGAARLRAFEASAPWPRPLVTREGLRIVDRDRVLHWNGHDLVPDERFAIDRWRRPGTDRYELKGLANGEIWAGLGDRITRLEPRDDGRFEPLDPLLGLPSSMNFDMQPDPLHPRVLWLSTEQGPARVETDRLETPTVRPNIRFLPAASVLMEAEHGAGADELPTLRHSAEALRFEVAVPFYGEESLNTFQFRLPGLDESWTPWTRETVKEYTNLPGGDYRFEVRAQHAGRILGQAAFPFRVLPPWHRTWWALGLQALTLVGLLLLYNQAQQRKLARERAIANRERAMSQQLRDFDELKNEFLANTSHELRTPLFGIAGLAESLIDGVHGHLPRDARQDLAMLVASSRRLSRLVDDLLDFSRLRHRNLELQLSSVDLRPLVDIVLTLMRPLVVPERVELSSSLPDGLPPVVADENRLQQILHNLIAHAIEQTEEGSIRVTAETRQGSGSERVYVRVVDTGVGVSDTQRERLFRAFERTDGNQGARGTGLGLALAAQLVADHGGTLEVEESSDRGSTLLFDLPASDQPAAPADAGSQVGSIRASRAVLDSLLETGTHAATPLPTAAETGSAPPESPHGAEALAAAPPAHVLVVDDEPVNRLVVANYLAADNYRVSEARDGPEALRLLDTQVPDLILLDVMMPEMSGFQVCRRIRIRHPLEELPIIFLTARNQVDDLAAGYSAGANDYLVKPLSKQELLARVETHLRLLEAHRNLESLVDERMAQLEILRGLLPICASCKKIREDDGYWREIELYLVKHSEAELSHGICPECFSELYQQEGLDGGASPS